jgi:hypothetical protein
MGNSITLASDSPYLAGACVAVRNASNGVSFVEDTSFSGTSYNHGSIDKDEEILILFNVGRNKSCSSNPSIPISFSEAASMNCNPGFLHAFACADNPYSGSSPSLDVSNLPNSNNDSHYYNFNGIVKVS